jgi:hypothetical protein
MKDLSKGAKITSISLTDSKNINLKSSSQKLQIIENPNVGWEERLKIDK